MNVAPEIIFHLFLPAIHVLTFFFFSRHEHEILHEFSSNSDTCFNGGLTKKEKRKAKEMGIKMSIAPIFRHFHHFSCWLRSWLAFSWNLFLCYTFIWHVPHSNCNETMQYGSALPSAKL